MLNEISCLCCSQLGNHDSLKKKKGLYWELVRQQELEE